MSKESTLAIPGSFSFDIASLRMLDTVCQPFDAIIFVQNLNSASLVVIAALFAYLFGLLRMAFVWVLVLVQAA
jgi:hypothetical protein